MSRYWYRFINFIEDTFDLDHNRRRFRWFIRDCKWKIKRKAKKLYYRYISYDSILKVGIKHRGEKYIPIMVEEFTDDSGRDVITITAYKR